MNVQLVERAMQVFEHVFLLEGEDRVRAILEGCNGDEALRREVELLLENISGIEIDESASPVDDTVTVFARRASNRYELLEEVGRGGMGIVYRAVDTQLHREVAIKVIRTDSPDARQRFSAEAEIAARLEHPGVPPVHDVGLLPDGRPFLAMKLVEGDTLSSLLADRIDPTDKQASFLSAYESLCQVIAYAHSRDIIHRDLKPDNVMIGKFGEVQVMDWGIAKSLGERDRLCGNKDIPISPISSPSLATRAGTVMGTPAYMPPEQLAGRRNKQTDVFSLGAILCEILTGCPPYTGDTEGEVLHKSAKADLAEAERRLAACPADKELVAIAHQCLLPDTDDRPQDGSALARRVSAYLQEVQARLVEAERAKARSEAKALEEKKRHRVKVLLAATAFLLVAVVLGGWAWMSQREALRVRREAVLRSAARQRLNDARTKVIRLHQAAIEAPIDDLAAWESAQDAMEQSIALLDADAPVELANEINELAKLIEAGVSHRRLLTRVERAREKSLEEVSALNTPEPSKGERLDEQLQAAFATTPLNPKLADTAAARQLIQSMEEPVKEAMIGAIDEWSVVCDTTSQRHWLARMIAAIDDNAWRRRWRRAMLDRDANKLFELLDADLTLAQSPRSVLNLCTSVEALSPDVDAGETLRRIGERHFDDFWLNVALGDYTLSQGDRRRAVQHFHHALGMRPLGSVHRKLARTKLGYPMEVQQVLEHAQRALELNDRSATSWETLAEASFRLRRWDDAQIAYERRFLLSNDRLNSIRAYIGLLQQVGRVSQAIDYLRGLRDSQPLNWNQHCRLIRLLLFENRHLEAINEFKQVSAWPRIAPEQAPLERILAAASAIEAFDGLEANSIQLPDSERDELFRKAHRWLTQAWVSWEIRATWQKKNVLRRIVELRDSGKFDTVYRAESLHKLPIELQSAWSNFWSDIQEAERRFEKLHAMMPEYGPWTLLEPISVSSESGARFLPMDDGSLMVSGRNKPQEVFVIESEIDPTGINAIRLDMISDERTPERDVPDGHFQLAQVELRLPDASAVDGSRRLTLDRADATYSSKMQPVENAIDGNRQTAWSIPRSEGVSHSAIFHLRDPIPSGSGKKLIVRLIQGENDAASPTGRFRLSVKRAP